MKKNVIVTLLVAMLCLSSFGAAAKQDTKVPKDEQAVNVTATEETTLDENAATEDTEAIEEATEEATDEDVIEEDTEEETDEDVIEEDTEEETDEDVIEEDTEEATDEDEAIDEDQDVKQEHDKEINGKSKVVKEALEAKKQERAAARLEAKDFINDLRDLFKDADKETKKEILSQIADLKKELKDYSIGVFVKGLVVDFEKYDNVKPVIKENRTLIPVRAITESLGAEVVWDEATSTITITKDDTTIVMQLDSKEATVNGEAVELEVAPTTEKGRTLVPIRFITETLQLNVEWDDNSQTVVIEE